MPEWELTILGIRNVRELIAISTWYLWWERRKLVHKEKTQDANQITMGIRAITLNYVLAISPKATIKRARGFVKLNVDASFDHDRLRGTAGDDKGKFIARGNWRIHWCMDILTVEAMTLRYGLSIAQRAGCNRLVINSDNIEVIETMNNGGRSSSTAAAVFDNCYFLACDFLLLNLSIIIEKQIGSPMNLLS